jgi:hypothetical protein
LKAKVVLIIVLEILISVFIAACGTPGPTSPEVPPPPDTNEYYDLKVEYNRPDILAPDFAEDIPYIDLYSPEGSSVRQLFTRIDNYQFKCEFLHVKALSSSYYFHLLDRARYNGEDYSSVMVGDILIVTVKQTEFIRELKDIRPYTLPTNPYPGPFAEAAFFILTQEGAIISDP